MSLQPNPQISSDTSLQKLRSSSFKPLLADAWGRALMAGVCVGMIPIVLVVWIYFDRQFASKQSKLDFESMVFLRSIGLLGDAIPWLILGLYFAVLGIFGKRRDIATWAAFLILSIATSGAVANILKLIFVRSRPNWEGVVPDGGSFSFPSGHAATMGAVATVCILRWPKLFPVAAGLVVLVCLNRVVSLNHHLTDVILGVVVGVCTTQLVQWCWWKYQPHSFSSMQ